MAMIIVSGHIHKQAATRTSKNGFPYVTATLKNRDGFWRLTAFDEEAKAELMDIQEGGICGVSGELRAEIFRPEGAEPRLSLGVIVDKVISGRPKARKRKPKKQAPILTPVLQLGLGGSMPS